MSATITTSIVTAGSNNHATTSSEANAPITDFVNQGVLGSITNTSGVAPATGSFAINQDASPDMGVTIKGTGNTVSGASVAYVQVTPLSQDKQILRARMTADYTSYTINSNATGSTVYDWIYLQASATNANTPSAGADNVITLFTSRSTSSSSDNGSPPTYGILLAVVTVANGASSITNANIADHRTQVTLSTGSSASTTGWNTLSYALTYSANNTNREFQVTTPNDLTGTLTPGMRFSVTRSVSPPTQCMAFTAASSQYATKASPSGITFTAAFTCEEWVYLNSYTGQTQYLMDRADGSTSGWYFRVNADRTVTIGYGTGSTFTEWSTIQAIPTKTWIHVAGVVSSTTSKTLQGIYFNAVSVPTKNVLNAAANLSQATANLSIGALNTGSANTFLDGYVSEARLWSAARTAQQIKDNMAVNLVGSETNLVGLWQGNGVFTDATSNANTLTATSGAIATQVANPYNSIEYALVTKVSYANPTTTLTLFTPAGYTIPNQTLNSPQYSLVKIPYGFPADAGLFRVSTLHSTSDSTTSNATYGAFLSAGFALSVPTGAWIVGHQHGDIFNITTTKVTFNISSTALTGLTATTGQNASPFGIQTRSSAAAETDIAGKITYPQVLSALTTYIMYTVGATTSAGIDGTGSLSEIFAESTYV